MNTRIHKDTILIVGFGNQAKSWALNLRDSKRDVVISLRRKSASLDKASQMGFETLFLDDKKILEFKNIVLLTPDHTHSTILKQVTFSPSARIIFAHGYGQLYQKFDQLYPYSILLLAPKSIASELRFSYETQSPISGVFSIENSRDKSFDEKFLKKLAKDLGFTTGPFECTFEQETHADLFSEQALLCSLLPYVAEECFKQLTKKEIPKELAYLEIWHEMKLIIATMVEKGPREFFNLISPNALIGSQKGKNLLIDSSFKRKLKTIIDEISNGKYEQETQSTDYESLKNNVDSYWAKSPFHSCHTKMAENLYQPR